MLGKICLLLWELWPFFRLHFVRKTGFRALSFENNGVLNSYFIHRYIIIKYRSSSMFGIIRLLWWELWPFIDYILYEKLVSVHYLLKTLMYWFLILYSGI